MVKDPCKKLKNLIFREIRRELQKDPHSSLPLSDIRFPNLKNVKLNLFKDSFVSLNKLHILISVKTPIKSHPGIVLEELKASNSTFTSR